MNLYLIGFRCTGKTRVGEALADRLGWPMVDTDRCVSDAAGVSIARLVDERGWTYFRQQERIALERIAAGDGQVVATGGGIVLDARNIVTMQRSGRCVWLKARVATIEARIRGDDASAANRPALTDRGRIAEIEAVLSDRQPLYARAADLSIDTDGETIQTLCDRIEAFL